MIVEIRTSWIASSVSIGVSLRYSLKELLRVDLLRLFK